MKRPILLFCFILFFLCSCQSKKGDSLFLPLSELKPLTLGMMPTLEGLPFYIARSEGIYDSLGLDLTILPFNSANDRDAVFQTGQMDGMVTDYPSAITLQAIHHTELGFIFKNDGYLCFIVSKESRINQPEQLIEKNIAVSRNTVVEYATCLLYTSHYCLIGQRGKTLFLLVNYGEYLLTTYRSRLPKKY